MNKSPKYYALLILLFGAFCCGELYSQVTKENCDLVVQYRGEVNYSNLVFIQFIVPTAHFLMGEAPNGYYSISGFEVNEKNYTQTIDSDYKLNYYCNDKDLLLDEILSRNETILITISALETEDSGMPIIPMKHLRIKKEIPINYDNVTIGESHQIIITIPKIILSE